MIKFDKKQMIEESLETTMRYLDPTGSDMDGLLQAYLEAHLGTQPADILHSWDDELWEAYDKLKNDLLKLNKEQLMSLIADRAKLMIVIQGYFESYETEYEAKVADLLAHELQIATIRGYNQSDAGYSLMTGCRAYWSLMNRRLKTR